jgi:pimeloyl-ACP methyl ester carboxylesterase
MLTRACKQTNPGVTRVVITGHSLGAGTASILALLLHTGAIPSVSSLSLCFSLPSSLARSEFPVECFAYAPPPVLSPSLAARCLPFVHSFVFRDDAVPRLSLNALYDLRDRAANATLSTHRYAVGPSACVGWGR